MNYRNRFRLAVLSLALLASCKDHADSMRIVAPDAYAARSCWFDKSGNLTAFLVFGKRKLVAVPYVISSRCSIDESEGNYGVTTLLHLTTISLVDNYDKLHAKYPSLEFSNSLRSDQPIPSASSKIYYLRAKVKKMNGPYGGIYAPIRIATLLDTNVNLLGLFEMSENERRAFARRFAGS